jgi:UDP-2,4-diacetamido-2,4,6-trideoxy-beta-L-altropyranose hydrolase
MSLEDMLSIRRANAFDKELYFRWVNDQLVRQSAFQSGTISRSEHECWFSAKLGDNTCYLYVIESGKNPIGQVRIEIKDRLAEIDYSIDCAYRGQGFGRTMLTLGIEQFALDFHRKIELRARVKSENTASRKIFGDLGFVAMSPLEDHDEIDYRHMPDE